MKSLDSTSNGDKIKIVFSLFPEYVQEACKAITYLADDVEVNDTRHRKTWPKNHIMSYDYWKALAAESNKSARLILKKTKHPANFIADELGRGMVAAFSIHCIMQYAESLDLADENHRRFNHLVKALFH